MPAIRQDLALDFFFQPLQAGFQPPGQVVQADARQRQHRGRFQPRQSVRRFVAMRSSMRDCSRRETNSLERHISSELAITSRPWLKIAASRVAMVCGSQTGSE